jgi:hypothetical protein
MALREFVDRSGREWKVWDVRPDELPKATRMEDYLRPMVDGWLVFESIDGGERRRVFPVPEDWPAMSDGELERLREVAPPEPDTGDVARERDTGRPPPP